jgi:hypothetical protein
MKHQTLFCFQSKESIKAYYFQIRKHNKYIFIELLSQDCLRKTQYSSMSQVKLRQLGNFLYLNGCGGIMPSKMNVVQFLMS